MKECILQDCERQPCEVWTRVMGYFRPVNHFNNGKKSEYNECGIQTVRKQTAASVLMITYGMGYYM